MKPLKGTVKEQKRVLAFLAKKMEFVAEMREKKLKAPKRSWSATNSGCPVLTGARLRRTTLCCPTKTYRGAK